MDVRSLISVMPAQINQILIQLLASKGLDRDRVQSNTIIRQRPMEDFFHYNPSQEYQGDQMWKLMKMVTPEENPAVYMPAHFDPLQQQTHRISSSPIKQNTQSDLDIVKIEYIQPNSSMENNLKIKEIPNVPENEEAAKKEALEEKCKEEKKEKQEEQAKDTSAKAKEKHRRKNIVIPKKTIVKTRVKTLKQLQKDLKGKCFQIFGSLYATTDESILKYEVPIIDYSAPRNFNAECLSEIVEMQDQQLQQLQTRMIQSYGIDFIEETKEKKTYKCTQCERVFAKASALGGHVSKMHSLHAQQVKKANALKKKKKSN